jgi:hypothetical protein
MNKDNVVARLASLRQMCLAEWNSSSKQVVSSNCVYLVDQSLGYLQVWMRVRVCLCRSPGSLIPETERYSDPCTVILIDYQLHPPALVDETLGARPIFRLRSS